MISSQIVNITQSFRKHFLSTKYSFTMVISHIVFQFFALTSVLSLWEASFTDGIPSVSAHFVALDVFCSYIFSITGVILVNLFYSKKILVFVFSFLDFICVFVYHFSKPFFKITRSLLITSSMTNTTSTCIITDFTMFWLIAKILLENNNIYVFTIYLTYTVYSFPVQNNDITRRVVMFP